MLVLSLSDAEAEDGEGAHVGRSALRDLAEERDRPLVAELRDATRSRRRATVSEAIASPPPSCFGKRRPWYLGRSATSRSAPQASIARVRSEASPCPVANAKSAEPAFLFCT